MYAVTFVNIKQHWSKQAMASPSRGWGKEKKVFPYGICFQHFGFDDKFTWVLQFRKKPSLEVIAALLGKQNGHCWDNFQGRGQITARRDGILYQCSFLLEGVRGQTEQKGKQWFTDNLLAVVWDFTVKTNQTQNSDNHSLPQLSTSTTLSSPVLELLSLC